MKKENVMLGEYLGGGLFNLRFLPRPEEDMPKNDCERLIFDAMNLISSGKAAQGRKKLEMAWLRYHSWRAGMQLMRGIIDGWFAEKDYEYAVRILRTMILEGNPLAMNDLACLYQTGKGVKKSVRWAIYWFEKANAHGCLEAKSNLAQIFILGAKKYRDDARGFLLLKEAMKEGDSEAFNIMGICYNKGYGVKRDAQKAFKMYTKAYELGAGPASISNLANMYFKGQGVKPDRQKAKVLFQEAKDGGYPVDEDIVTALQLT